MLNEDDGRGVLVSVLAGIGIGVLVGAVAGLLLAPRSGEELRNDIGKSLGDITDRFGDLSKNISQRVSSVVEKTRATVGQKLGEMGADGDEAGA